MLGALVKVAILAVVMVEGGGMIGVALPLSFGASISAIGGLAITLRQARRQGALLGKAIGPDLLRRMARGFLAPHPRRRDHCPSAGRSSSSPRR